MEVPFLILLFVFGACMGSFLCCQVRRLHLRTSTARRPRKSRRQSPRAKAKKAKAKPHSAPAQSLGSRSVCLHCRTQLRWYDNIPVISWLALHGRCRSCGRPIGALEIYSELGVAIAFTILGTTVSPLSTCLLGWLVFAAAALLTLVLSFLAIYDGAYGELPTCYLIIAILLALVLLALEQVPVLALHPFTPELILAPLASVAVLGGLYLFLYLVSRGKWVGDGDWLLGTALGLALGHPWLALIALCLANLLACLITLPTTKKSRPRQVHFGPFMVAAFVITYSFSSAFMSMIA